jgi:hypothetical protein
MMREACHYAVVCNAESRAAYAPRKLTMIHVCCGLSAFGKHLVLHARERSPQMHVCVNIVCIWRRSVHTGRLQRATHAHNR